MVLTIFLHRIDGLLLKYEMIIFLSGILSGFRIFFGFFSNFEISMVLTIFLHRIDGSLLKYDMIIFLSGFFSNFQNSMASAIFLHRIDTLLKYDQIFLSGILSGFLIFFWIFRIFSYFLQILIHLF